MLETLITSQTRIKLLLKFFLNKEAYSHLRGLASELNESSNAIRIELNKFEAVGLLHSKVSGNKKIFQANTSHPLFLDLHSILMKFTGLDQIIEKVIIKAGNIEKVYITGDLARGKNSDVIDLLIAGYNLNRNYINSLVEKAELLIKRKIRIAFFTLKELDEFLLTAKPEETLLIWE